VVGLYFEESAILVRLLFSLTKVGKSRKAVGRKLGVEGFQVLSSGCSLSSRWRPIADVTAVRRQRARRRVSRAAPPLRDRQLRLRAALRALPAVPADAPSPHLPSRVRHGYRY